MWNVGVLDAAHVQGKDRKTIALRALGASESSTLVRIADLSQAEAKILRAHEPLEKCF